MLFGVLLITLWPIGVIWSVNTLFDTNIPINFKTWLATIVLCALLRAPFSGKE